MSIPCPPAFSGSRFAAPLSKPCANSSMNIAVADAVLAE